MAESWQNPYTPGPATIPPALTGRDELLAQFHGYLQAREAGGSTPYTVISGQRGMGKTVLLYKFRDLAVERDWLALRVEATDRGPFLASLADGVADLLEGSDARPGLLRRARQALDQLTVAVGVGPAKVEVAAKRAEPAGPVDVPVERLINSWGTVAKERKVGAVLLVDEIQAVPAPALRALARAFQAAEGDRLPIVFAAGGLPNAPDRLRDAVSYAERYRYVTLSRLSPTAVRVALEAPAAALDVAYHPEALDHLISAAEGYPYLVQLLGSTAWEAANGNGPITLGHAHVAATAARAELTENLLRARWIRASKKERAYLAAMASLGPHPVASAEIARALGETAQQLSTTRQRLMDKGLVTPAGARALEFALPGLGEFILQTTGANPADLASSGSPPEAAPPPRPGTSRPPPP